MSADLDEATGKPAMAYVGERPWHGLGERLPPGQGIDEWVRAARLNWEIEMVPVTYQVDGKHLVMPRRFVLARSDTHAALSVVSGDYLVVQPKEVLEFYRDLVQQGGYQLETAGALDGGRKVWGLARTGLVAGVSRTSDPIGAYVLLATSCDKTMATTLTFTSIRVVCQNTLSFAIRDSKNQNRHSIKVEHNKRFDAAHAKHALGLMSASWKMFTKSLSIMADAKLSKEQSTDFFESILLSEKEKQDRRISHQKHIEISQLQALYRSAPGQDLETAKGTLWGAVCAVTYYVDSVRPTSGDRMDSAWFGSGASLKERAWQQALQRIGS